MALTVLTLSAATLASAVSAPVHDASPIAGKSLGQLTYEGMRDQAFAERVRHFLLEHGIDHPQKLVTVETRSPLDTARIALTEETMQGRSVEAWLEIAKPENLAALQPATPRVADLATEVVRIERLAGARPTIADERAVARAAADVPAELRAPFAALVATVADAMEAQKVVALGLAPRIETAQGAEDFVLTSEERETSLASALAIVAAQNAFRDAVRGLDVPASASTPIFRDPFGLVVLAGEGDDVHTADGLLGDPAVVVDLGGDDRYEHGAGAACASGFLLAHATCNLLAAAAVLDISGDDTYTVSGYPTYAQGAGSYGGVGVLHDVLGNDVYFSHMSRTTNPPITLYIDGGSQGFGLAGVGILLDTDGRDQHTANVQTVNRYMFNLAQGYGGVGGVGILANHGGDDGYFANGLSSEAGNAFQGVYTNGASIYAGVGIQVDTGLGDDAYAAFDQASTTDYYAQGFGAFGGLGVLFEDGGDDSYSAVEEATSANPRIVPLLNCAFGTGSLGGMGVFLEMGGDDVYFGDTRSPRAAWTMNEGFAGPGMAYGLHVDVSGDDGHFMEANGGAGSRTMGRGVVVVALGAVLLDVGGNMVGTYLDLGGADQYSGASPSRDGATWTAGADINVPQPFLGVR